MKQNAITLCVALAISFNLLPSTVRAQDKTPAAGEAKPSSRVEAGPRKGRILAVGEPKAEFLVDADKTISIKFYDKENKAVAPADQSVTAIVDVKGKKTKMEFEKKGDALVSRTMIPEGDGNPVVVQFRTDAKAKPVNFRFKLDLATCAECKGPEYACTCEGH